MFAPVFRCEHMEPQICRQIQETWNAEASLVLSKKYHLKIMVLVDECPVSTVHVLLEIKIKGQNTFHLQPPKHSLQISLILIAIPEEIKCWALFQMRRSNTCSTPETRSLFSIFLHFLCRRKITRKNSNQF